MPSTNTPTDVNGTTLTVDASQNPTFTGSYGGVFGAYDLYGPAALEITGAGAVLIQDSVLGDTLFGVQAEGTTNNPLFWIETGAAVTVEGQGAGDVTYGFDSEGENAGFQNDGTLSVSSTGLAVAVALKAGGLFINHGTISATSSGDAAYGVVAGDNVGGVSNIVNTGTITAQYAVNGTLGTGHLVVTNSGTLNGEVVLGTAAGNTVGNTGAINGSVVFQGTNGQQLYDGRGGTLSGTLSFASGTTVTGTDIAYLGNDSETVQGGSALLYVYGGTGADHITGGSGNSFIDGGGGNDVLDGGTGLATVAYGSATAGVTVSLALQGQAQNTIGDGTDTLTHFQNIIGSAYADHLTGDANDNIIDGGGGDDVLDGGGGINTVSFATAAHSVTVSLALQGAAQNTGVGSDTLANFQNVLGSAFNDTIEGDGANNVLDGGAGTNTVSYAHAASGVTVSLALQGTAQNTGGAGTDTLANFRALVGSAYGDTLEGGGSTASTLTGGLGADTFVYRSGDGNVTVTDFSDAQGDKIDLSHLGAVFSLSDVLAQSSQVGSDTVIALGGGTLTLQGVVRAGLQAADFVFSPSAAPTVGPGVGGAPTTGNGTLTGTSGDDWLQGGGGNDTLHGGAGSDYLDGGAGLNTATYDGVYRQYTIGAGGATVTGGPEGGTDDLVNIQRIQFVDGYLATSASDTAGQVYRLYEATLGRAPDQAGLTNWVNSLNSGTGLQSVVDGFVGSQEFQAVYGTLSNADFVTLLYHNVLHRDPDTSGLNNWVSLLSSGQDSRAQVVLGFSESPEDIAASAPAVQQGLWIANADASEVARLYDAVFGRLPDAAGLANWTHSLETGSSLQSVANGFVGSQEFQAVYGALSNTDFVTLLYHNVLHRDPDTSGLNNWVNLLASGQDTRAQVVVGFSESNEHITNTAPHIDSGIWLAS